MGIQRERYRSTRVLPFAFFVCISVWLELEPLRKDWLHTQHLYGYQRGVTVLHSQHISHSSYRVGLSSRTVLETDVIHDKSVKYNV